MTPDRWRRIEELFESVAEIAPESREAFLDRECRDDVIFRKQVESLIVSGQQADTYLHSAIRVAAESVITVDVSDFQVYRRNKRERIPLLFPPGLR